MNKLAKIGVLAVIFLAFGCASIPEVPPVEDTRCEFHKKNPGTSKTLFLLWEACMHGDMEACHAYGLLHLGK